MSLIFFVLSRARACVCVCVFSIALFPDERGQRALRRSLYSRSRVILLTLLFLYCAFQADVRCKRLTILFYITLPHGSWMTLG